jgi:hypothetical protein
MTSLSPDGGNPPEHGHLENSKSMDRTLTVIGTSLASETQLGIGIQSSGALLSKKTHISSRNGSSLCATISATEKLTKILLQTRLFNISELNNTLKELKFSEDVIQSKYIGESPAPLMNYTVNFGQVSTSRPPAATYGPTVVDELIQLGEQCVWLLEKGERKKHFERALFERFFQSLLEVELLFDPLKLKNMFKAGRAGATSCTNELMKAVEEMVRKADKPGQEGKIFKFNAEKILGESYQMKFCCSVEVVMKRYRSNDPYGHLAQHFREVLIMHIRTHSRFASECFLLGRCKSCLIATMDAGER